MRQTEHLPLRAAALPRRAFTLLETLLVLVIGGMLLLAAVSFLFSVIMLRQQIDETPQFGQHADGVSRMLEMLFSSADTVPPAGQDGVGTAAQARNAQPAAPAASASLSGGGMNSLLSWRDLPSGVTGRDKALYFKTRTNLPVILSKTGAIDSVVECYLVLESGSGLVLYWRDGRMQREDNRNWERTVLTQLADSVRLLYYDAAAERWEETDRMEPASAGEVNLPQVMVLGFTDPSTGRRETAEVLLPVASPQLLGL